MLNWPLRQMCRLTKSTGFSLHKTRHLRCVSKYLHDPRVSRTVLFRSWGRIADRVGPRWPKSCLCEIPCVTLRSSTAFQKCVETFPGSCHSVLTKPSWVIHECGYLLLRWGTGATQKDICGPQSQLSRFPRCALKWQLRRRASDEVGRSENTSVSGNAQTAAKLRGCLAQDFGKCMLAWILPMPS